MSEEEEDGTLREGNLKQSKMNVFEQMFAKWSDLKFLNLNKSNLSEIH